MNDTSSYQDNSSVFPEDVFSDEAVEDMLAIDSNALNASTDNFETMITGVSNEKLEGVMELIDNELVRIASREVLPAHEVTDLLLDLRLQLVGTLDSSA